MTSKCLIHLNSCKRSIHPIQGDSFPTDITKGNPWKKLLCLKEDSWKGETKKMYKVQYAISISSSKKKLVPETLIFTNY